MAQDVTGRFLWQNWCQLANTTVTASSQQTAYPDDWLKDPQRSKIWRSALGWTVIAGFNDKLNFIEGSSAHTATLTAGTYATGTSFASHIQTQMNAVSEVSTGTPYTVAYSDSTYKYTITRGSTKSTFGFEFATGLNTTASIAKDIGFNPSSDLVSVSSGTDSYSSTAATHQSRHYIKYNFGAAKDVQVAMLHFTNIPTSGVVTLEANTTDAWGAPAASTSLTLGDVHINWLTSTNTYRHWRFVLDNTKTSAGYTYVGVPYLGEYLQPTPGISNRFTEEWNELSEIGFADQGAPFQNEKDRGRGYKIVLPGLTDNEKNKIKQMANFVRLGRPFFFSNDPQNDADDAIYVMAINGISIQKVTPTHWQVSMQVEEAIG